MYTHLDDVHHVDTMNEFGLDIIVCREVVIVLPRLFFFFSSRRRHTRFDCDWSSDVCSSDLTSSRSSSASHAMRVPVNSWMPKTRGPFCEFHRSSSLPGFARRSWAPSTWRIDRKSVV